MKIIFTLILGLFPFLLMAQSPRISVSSQAEIAEIQKNSRKINAGIYPKAEGLPITLINGEKYIGFLGKLKPEASFDFPEGVIVGKGVGNIRSIRVRLDKLAMVFQLNQFENIEIARKIAPLLDRAIVDTRADSVHLGIDLPQGYSGKNVLIGVNDWGFDFTSPVFYDSLLQNSRILAAWDQWKRSGPQPQSFNYGTEFNTWQDLSAIGSDTSNQYGYATHATHVAGIAGGSGAGKMSVGMAYDAEFLFTTLVLDEAAAIDSWYWMYEKALLYNKNLVINMSWGLYNMGTSDGTSLLSLGIQDLTDHGVLFVSSAGNNGGVNFHFEREFNNDSIKSVVGFDDYSLRDSLWGQSIHGWGEPGKDFEVKIQILSQGNSFLDETPYFSTTMNNYLEDIVVLNANDTVYYKISAESAHPQNGKPNVRFQVKNENTSYKIVLVAKAVAGKIHFWNLADLTTKGGNWGLPFSSLGSDYISGNNQYGIGEPACADDCLAVASHVSSYVNDYGYTVGGARSNFSSIGPRNDGAQKPDVSAPGTNVLSAISSFTNADYVPVDSVDFNGRTYHFARFSGTSMAGPAAAGVCALVWEANPYLSPRQIKQIMMETARQDEKTGVLSLEGDLKWGFGKVDALAAVKTAFNFVGTSQFKEEGEWIIFPNPTATTFSVKGIENADLVQLIDMNGKVRSLDNKETQWDVSNFSNGTYLLRIVTNKRVYQKKIVIQK